MIVYSAADAWSEARLAVARVAAAAAASHVVDARKLAALVVAARVAVGRWGAADAGASFDGPCCVPTAAAWTDGSATARRRCSPILPAR
jgi:hypothetical protein